MSETMQGAVADWDEVRGWDFRPYQHWTEIFSRRCNWKNFTLIAFEVEYADHLRSPGYFELHIGLLGFGIITHYGGGPETDGMKELREAAARTTNDSEART